MTEYIDCTICIGCLIIVTALVVLTILVLRSRAIINRIAKNRLHSVREILKGINGRE